MAVSKNNSKGAIEVLTTRAMGRFNQQLSEELSEDYSKRHRLARDRNCLKSVASRCKYVQKT
jgi:hypothetical protein